MKDPIFFINPEYQVINLNKAAADTFTEFTSPGAYYYAGELITLKWLRDYIHELEENPDISDAKDLIFQERLLQTNQGDRWFELRSQRMLDISGKFSGTVVICQDISERKTTALKLRQLSQVCEQSSTSIVITDIQGKIEYVNPKFEEVTGYTLAEVQGKNPRILRSGYSSSKTYRELWQAITHGQTWRGEFHNRKKNGELYWESATISPLKDAQGQTTHYMAIKEDITLRKQTEAQLNYQSNYDILTTLPNRAYILRLLRQDLVLAQYNQEKVAILCLDLDHFKTINETLGHGCGDQLLVEVAHRLQGCMRRTDKIGRLGGDEFLLIVHHNQLSTVMELVHSILETLQTPFILPSNDAEWFLSASIGITISPDDGEQVNVLLRNADIALYQAKSLGRNTWVFFTACMTEKAHRRQLLSQSLRQAIANQEFYLAYQPIVNLHTQAVIGAEALVRWESPILGQVSPDEFIAVAEESYLIVQLGSWVLDQVCHQLQKWQALDIPLDWIAVNLSARQFHDSQLLSYLTGLLSTYNLKPQSIKLEITERLLMDDVTGSVDVLLEIDAMGFPLALDDFGTGYSSLSYCKRFPFSTLKVDKSFITDLPQDAESAALTRAIIAMAHELGLTVVAEGIETLAQLNFLQQEGCDFGQGYYFAPALLPLQFEQYWHRHHQE